MQSAIFFGLSQNLSDVSQQAPFACPSSNCTFPPFTSLHVCHSCADLTPRITRGEADPRDRLNITLDPTAPGAAIADNDPIVRYSLPNGLYLDNSADLTSLGTTNASLTLAHHNLTTLIWSQTFLRQPPGTNTTLLSLQNPSAVTATECALYYCISSFTSTVINSLLDETIHPLDTVISPSSFRLLPPNPSFPDTTDLLPPSRQSSLSYHPRFSFPRRTDLTLNEKFNLSQSAINSISSFFQSTFSSCTGITNCSSTLEAVSENWTPINGFYMNTVSGVRYAPSSAQVFYNTTDVTGVFEAIARSMTNALRSGADETFEGGKVVGGEVGKIVILYRVEWRWIVLHAVVVVLGAMVVVWVVVEAYVKRGEVPLWGSSALAVLAKGGVVGGLLGGTGSVEEMKNRAREAEVVLFRAEEVELMEASESEGWGRGFTGREADVR